jgi:hypothetical protein
LEPVSRPLVVALDDWGSIGRHKPCPNIAKRIEPAAGDDPWRYLNRVVAAHVFLARWMDKSTTIEPLDNRRMRCGRLPE